MHTQNDPCVCYDKPYQSGIILCMPPANERWRYNVMSSLIGWGHKENDLTNGCYICNMVWWFSVLHWDSTRVHCSICRGFLRCIWGLPFAMIFSWQTRDYCSTLHVMVTLGSRPSVVGYVHTTKLYPPCDGGYNLVFLTYPTTDTLTAEEVNELQLGSCHRNRFVA